MSKTILLTGGAGFIGSHTAVELLNAGYEVVVVDDFSNCSPDVIDRIGTIAGKNPICYKLDVACGPILEAVFEKHHIDAVIHFAGFKAVGESVQKPLKYYRNNLDTTLTLLEVMAKYNGIDLYICASTCEGTPNPVLEAMSCGVPIISTDVGLVPEVFGNKQRQFILKERSVKCMVDVLKKLLDLPELFSELSKENLFQIKPWDWSIMTNRMRDYFR